MIHRRGFSLIELLCVMGLLFLIGLIAAVVFKETLAMERLQSESFDKALQANALADQFRADVALAESTPDDWQQFTADANTLILQLKQRGHIVYDLRDGRLTRHAFDGAEKSSRGVASVNERTKVEFVRGGADSKLVRLRLHKVKDGQPVQGQSLEIAAALGGDWR